MVSAQARTLEKINAILWVSIFLFSFQIYPSVSLIEPAAVGVGGMFGQISLYLYRVILEQVMSERPNPLILTIATTIKIALLFVAVYSLAGEELAAALSALLGFSTIVPAAAISSIRTANKRE